ETFTGTVNGVPGTATFRVASVGDATSFQETVVIIGGTGALADLRGVLSAAGTVPGGGLPFGTYSGQIHAGQPRRTRTVHDPILTAQGRPGRRADRACPLVASAQRAHARPRHRGA